MTIATPQHAATPLPADLPTAIRETKEKLRAQLGGPEGVQAAFREVESFIKERVAEIEEYNARGESIWPEIAYDDIAEGNVSDEFKEQVRRYGVLVVRGHFPREKALDFDRELVDYVDKNDFDAQYRGPGDDFFGTLAASRPEIFPIYWSKPQMQARQSERTANVQAFLNHRWKFESDGVQWFDPNQDSMYPDRIRRRPPGTNSSGLGAHTDSGAVERWLLPAYQKVFKDVFTGNFADYDPWDAAHRTEVNEYEGGSTMCSAFRTFQGWTALSDQQRDQGVLATVPIPEAMAYILLRALLDDVADDDLCGAAPSRVLAVNDKWHPLLMRGLTNIPNLQAGDSVWWHADIVHAVDPVEDQQGWGNVMYIPAAPMCEKNRAYSTRVAEHFREGTSPDDFPAENYEVQWQDRFTEADLNDIGRRGLGLE